MSGKQDDRLREQCHAEQATASAAGDSQRGGRLRRLRDRLRAWWRNPSIMRAFFVYALVWLVAASAVTLIAIDALMEVYYRVSEEHRSEHVEVNVGPYIYDAQTDELLRATPVYLQDFYEQVVFVAFTNSAQNYSSAGVVAGGWNRDMQVVDATMELLRSDPSYRVSDWGGNYTEDDYLQTDGTPYDPEATVSVSDLPAYDARERAERLQTVEEFANTNLGEDVVLSNVAYYVSLDEASYLTWIDWTLRLVAGVGVPIVAFGGLAVLLFRRFYRRHVGGPLSVLEAAADRIARQDLDFQIGAVRGRELGRLGAAMEGMLSPEIKEEITANVEVQQVFKISKVGTVAGCIVKEGKIKRTNKVRLIRDGIVIYSGELGSLKRFKDDAKEVVAGQDCGLNIANFNDIQVGDVIEAYEETEVKKTL